MPSIFSLFDILALIYVFRSVQLGLKIWREWSDLIQEPLTAARKHVAEQASYFIAVPLGVLFHELGHALAVWASGGQVAEFHYRAFWGYVVPIGEFTAQQNWFIAIAGTLASLAFGILVWLFFRRSSSSTLRYFGLRAFRFQVYFSLIYYPLFTLLGFIGDWRTIYDFGATPLLSALTAILHAGTLFLFWRGDRQGWFEAPSHTSVAEQQQFERLAAASTASPDDVKLQIQYIDALRRGGANRKAQHELQSFLKKNPDSAAAYLELAALSMGQAGKVSKKASQYAAKALSLGLPENRQIAFANELLGRYELETGQTDSAAAHFAAALAYLPENDRGHRQLLLLRGQALRRQQRYEEAYQDIHEAMQEAERADDKAGLGMAQQELETLENHAGRTFGASHYHLS